MLRAKKRFSYKDRPVGTATEHGSFFDGQGENRFVMAA